jgi:hypothetical protein
MAKLKEKSMQPINENPQYKAVAGPLAEIQSEIVQNERRLEEIRIELSRPRKADLEDSFAVYLTADGAEALDSRIELREEYQRIEERHVFLQSALERGRAELDNVTGQLSLVACKEIRSCYIAALKKQLSALKQVCDANAELVAIRDELERAGYKSGSLPFAQFSFVGSAWGSSGQVRWTS